MKKLMYPRALEIATQAHFGQFRRNPDLKGKHIDYGGKYLAQIPYITHPIAVAAEFDNDFERTVAVLHDVYEDAPEFIKIIEKEFPKNVCDCVRLLSRIKGETYFDFIFRIKNSHDYSAIKIKIVDIDKNSETLEEGATKDKYRFAKFVLLLELSKENMNELYEVMNKLRISK